LPFWLKGHLPNHALFPYHFSRLTDICADGDAQFNIDALAFVDVTHMSLAAKRLKIKELEAQEQKIYDRFLKAFERQTATAN
jgi:hypothetical protein